MNLNINSVHQWVTYQDSTRRAIDIDDGYVYGLFDRVGTIKKIKQTLETMEETPEKFGGEFNFYDYSSTTSNVEISFRNDELSFYGCGNVRRVEFSISAKTEEMLYAFWKLFLDVTADELIDDKFIYYRTYVMTAQGVSDSAKSLVDGQVERVNAGYYPYIDVELMFNQFFTSNENILILIGEPGLGKSKLATYALSHAFDHTEVLPYDKCAAPLESSTQYVNAAYVKNIDVLTSDEFWQMIGESYIDIVFIDDLDFMLTTRESDVQSADDMKRNAFLNQFLSFTDGIENNKTKFIITTNQSVNDLDKALVRKGRLFDIIELRRLTNSEAKDVWVDGGLDVDEFVSEFGGSECVLASDLGSAMDKRSNSKIENSLAPYLKEEGISRINEASRVKNLGL